MSQPNENSQHVRRVVLPSGRAIEVVYYETLADSLSAPGRRTGTTGDLHLCPDCDRGLVFPVEWEEVSPTHWEVFLRCPNCEWTELGVHDQATVDRFDDALDCGTEAMMLDLKRLTHANMEDEIERFAIALAADAIWPEDF